ncbi:MAG: Type 1 glutamine amidotransferase-like domain-containing protein [Candidatus Micrarchaeales archaeon]
MDKIILGALKKPSKKITIGYIPNAKNLQTERDRIENRLDKLRTRGFNVIEINLEIFKGRKLGEKLKGVDVIYVGGGNVFLLLNAMRKSGFAKILPKQLDKGKLYIGISAGSYVACPTIDAANWKPKHSDRNMIGLKDLTGLNLVPFLITAHFGEKYRLIIEKAAKRTNYPIVALYDTRAILVEGRKYRIIGTGKKEFFNGFKERR